MGFQSQMEHQRRWGNLYFRMQPRRSRYENGIACHFVIWRCSCCCPRSRCFDFDDSKYMVNRRWVFRYGNDKCADIEQISLYLGKWYVLTLLIYSFIVTSGEVYIWNIFWKVEKLSVCMTIFYWDLKSAVI